MIKRTIKLLSGRRVTYLRPETDEEAEELRDRDIPADHSFGDDPDAAARSGDQPLSEDEEEEEVPVDDWPLPTKL